MAGSTSDIGPRDKQVDPPVTHDSAAKVQADVAASTKGTADTTSASEVAGDTSASAVGPGVVESAGNAPAGSPEANAQAAAVPGVAVPDEGRVGPIPGDDPEANPSHPSSLRVRASDGRLALQGTRGGGVDIADQPPGFEAAETDARAVPSHPSKLVADPGGNFSLIDAAIDDPESGESLVRFDGPGAVSLIVPDGKSPGYNGLIVAGTDYTFRPGQTRPIKAGHAKWLLGHPIGGFSEVKRT